MRTFLAFYFISLIKATSYDCSMLIAWFLCPLWKLLCQNPWLFKVSCPAPNWPQAKISYRPELKLWNKTILSGSKHTVKIPWLGKLVKLSKPWLSQPQDENSATHFVFSTLKWGEAESGARSQTQTSVFPLLFLLPKCQTSTTLR